MAAVTRVVTDLELSGWPVMPVALDAIEAALAARNAGQLVAPPRHFVSFSGLGSLVFTVGGTTGAEPLAGFRASDTFGRKHHEQLVAVWSAETGELRGVFVGTLLGEIRTGAIGGIAIRHMSAPNAGEVGVLGTGPQARTQLMAAAAVRNLQMVRVFSRNEERRAAFASNMARELGLAVEAADSARAAVQDADIVICATNSTKPVLDRAWLRPGVHINTVGPKSIRGHELPIDIASNADLVATDAPEQIRAFSEPFFLDGTPAAERVVDLSSIVTGNVPVRTSGREMTLFCSVGLAGTEVLVAARVLAALDHTRAGA
jgi:ornithine cyclodeaminase/alanine dehydrogenase-like protein (mu-crystallin family)